MRHRLRHAAGRHREPAILAGDDTVLPTDAIFTPRGPGSRTPYGSPNRVLAADLPDGLITSQAERATTQPERAGAGVNLGADLITATWLELGGRRRVKHDSMHSAVIASLGLRTRRGAMPGRLGRIADHTGRGRDCGGAHGWVRGDNRLTTISLVPRQRDAERCSGR